MEGNRCGLKTLGAHFDGGVSDFSIALDADDELTMEGFHRGFGEDFEAGGVAVADAFESGGSGHFHVNLITGIRYEVAILVEDVDGDEGHVFAVILEGFDGCTEIPRELDLRRSSSGLDRFSADFIALFVIDHNLDFAWLILHVVPA